MKLKKVIEKKPTFKLKNQFLSCSTRAVLHNCQNDFDVNGDTFFLFFQRFLGEYSKYECPKIVSTTHRSSSVFKVTQQYYSTKLRYTAWKCDFCRHYFTKFNTTKPMDEWENYSLPTFATKFGGLIFCTDCVYLLDAY